MPENIAKFEVIDENCFEFGLKGMPEIKLVKKGGTPNSQIVLGAASSKLPFTLTGNLNAIDADNTEVQLAFEGDFNPMMAMMIKGPISKFIEIIIFQISDSLLLIVIFIQAISFIQQTC